MKTVGICIVSVCLIAASAGAGETVESLEKKLESVAGKVTSMSCKQRTVINLVMGGGKSMHQDKAGEFEYLKAGDQIMWRAGIDGPPRR